MTKHRTTHTITFSLAIALALAAACQPRARMPGDDTPPTRGDGGAPLAGECGDDVCDTVFGGETCGTCPEDCACDDLPPGDRDGGTDPVDPPVEDPDAGDPADPDAGAPIEEPDAGAPLEEPDAGPPAPTARAPRAGELVVSEVMADPYAVADATGEWFEVVNVSSAELDLSGLLVRDDERDAFTIAGALLVRPGGRVVLGVSADRRANGGAPVDYAYTGMVLANSGDEINLVLGSTLIDRVAWWGASSGRSVSLDASSTSATANDDASRWCDATTTFGSGDRGTPGSANGACPRSLSVVRTPVLAIPDASAAGIRDDLVVTDSACVVASVEVAVDIAHTYIGDLVVELVGPGGRVVRLHDQTGGSADDLTALYPVDRVPDGPGTLADLVGIAAYGTWQLRVTDNASADVGTLESWAVQIACR